MSRCRTPAILLTGLLCWSCAPVAPIQSARVRQAVIVGPQITYQDYRHELDYVCHACAYDYSTRQYHDTVLHRVFVPTELAERLSPYVWPRVGIAHRLELSGSFLPGWPYLWAWYVNAKVALSDNGSDLLFRNVATAVFAGTSGNGGEHGDGVRRAWAGPIVSTHHAATWGDLELVLMPSVAYYNEEFLLAGEGHLAGVKSVSLDVGLGVIYGPFERAGLEVTAGLTLHRPLQQEVYSYNASSADLGTPAQIRSWHSPYAYFFSLGYAIGRQGK
jgi:hypothetical protein